jgi:hypothetical protein
VRRSSTDNLILFYTGLLGGRVVLLRRSSRLIFWLTGFQHFLNDLMEEFHERGVRSTSYVAVRRAYVARPIETFHLATLICLRVGVDICTFTGRPRGASSKTISTTLPCELLAFPN